MNIRPIGTVRILSAEESLLEILPVYQEGLSGIGAGDRLQVLYWMHKLEDGDRQRLMVHPRGDRTRPLKGVFALRSPARPNPIGVSEVQVRRLTGSHLSVRGLDGLDGSPIIDIKGVAGRKDDDAGCSPSPPR
jgi:tRNA-Thr(GGU) m(6)t(6)A37 methyltransferase TsaA